ncbi:hypothetical protein [Haloplanus sp. C73]|uniref:hypothetical protein n=1 Tax=Haloplanus sp. C73 TaxID=3421641 RepID=UPI003EBF48EF
MVPTRRRTLQAAGATTVAALAGCFGLGDSESKTEYALDIESIDASPVDHALYRPDDDPLFGAPARTALDAILPDGRHTTYGYRPLSDEAYVEHEGTYYQTEHVVTGREPMQRRVVRVDPVPDEDVPDDAALVDDLERPSARVIKILHTYTLSEGETSTAELLRGDGYVLRRPAERESRLATGELDGRVVTMTEDGAWAYRVRVAREQVVETAHTALAIEVASDRERFREVVFGSRIDAILEDGDLSTPARAVLDEAIARGTYTETTPLSDGFEATLDALGIGHVDDSVNGKLLWDADALYRYALYVSTED